MRRWLPPVLGGIAIVALVVCWISIAPEAVGGRSIYLTTVGASMEPEISDGDIVVLRNTSDYQVGDVVGYDSGESLVLHRIIAIEGERFVLKGDGNPMPDSVRPTEDDIRGRLWLQISPPWEWNLDDLVPLILILGVLAAVGLIAYLARERVSGIRVPSAGIHLNGAASSERYARLLGPLGQILIVAVTILAVGALLLAVIGFSRPLERRSVERIPYDHQAAFSYSAPATGAIYDDGLATTGNPLYRELVDAVTVEMAYSLTSAATVDAGGSYRMDLVISNDDGWRTTHLLVPDREFSGGQFVAQALVELADIELLIGSFEEQTASGLSATPSEYLVSIVSTVRVDGYVGGQQFHDTLAPSLDFSLDERMLSLRTAPEGSGPGLGSMQTIAGGFVTEEGSTQNTVPFIVDHLDVSTVRQLGIIGLVLAIVMGAAILLMIRAGLQASEAAQIDARFGSRIVDLRATNLKTNGRMVELTSFNDLLKIADQRELHILHFKRNGRDFYFVHTPELTYGYRVNSNHVSPEAGRPLEQKDAQQLKE